MRLFSAITTRLGNQGALANARREIEANRLVKARVDAVARRLAPHDQPHRRRSGVA